MKPEEKAKEKAKELYSKVEDGITGLEGQEWWDSAKQCALIAVDELITEIKLFPYNTIFYERLEFLKQVKTEIENYENKRSMRKTRK